MSADEIGQRLKLFRQKLGLTTSDIAEKAGLQSRSSWERYERGVHAPNGEILRRLAYLGANINWVLLGEGEMLSGIPAAIASRVERDSGVLRPKLLERLIAEALSVLTDNEIPPDADVVASATAFLHHETWDLWEDDEEQFERMLEVAKWRLKRQLSEK